MEPSITKTDSGILVEGELTWSGALKFAERVVEFVEENAPERIANSARLKRLHTVFIDLWDKSYLSVFNAKYKFDAKDAKPVKKLVALDKSPKELIELAKWAWGVNSFDTNQAITIAGFASRYNQIVRMASRARTVVASTGERKWGVDSIVKATSK